MIRKNDLLLKYMLKLQKEDQTVATKLDFQAKERLFEQGQALKHVYIIESGLVKCSRIVEGGREFVQEIFAEGSLIGEVECYSQSTSFAYCEAKTDVKVLRISHRDFKSKIWGDRDFNELVMTTVVSKVREKGIRHSYQQTHKLKESLEILLGNHADLFKVFSKTEIANYLGTSVRNLNRLLPK